MFLNRITNHCHWALLTMLFAVSSPTKASQVLDSLKAELGKDRPDTAHVILLNGISAEFAEDYKLLDSAITYGHQALQLSLDIDYPAGKAAAAYRLAYAFDLSGKLQDALDHYELARQYYTETDNKEWIATSMHGKGVACYFQGDYGRSLEFYLAALDYERANGLLEKEANTLLNIGVLYRIMEKYDEAIRIYQQNIRVRKELKDSVNLAKAYNNMGVVYTYENQLDSAVTYLDSSIVIYQALKDSFLLASVYITLGDAYLEAGEELQKARYHLLNGYRMMRGYDDNIQQSKALLYLGQLESKSGHHDLARNYLFEGIRVLEDSELDEIRRDLHRALSRTSFTLGFFQEAYQNLNQAAILNDSINSKEKIKYMEEMQAKYETEKQNAEITKLNAQQAISKKTTEFLIATLILFGLLAAGLYFLYNKIKSQRNIISQTLTEKEELLENLKRAQQQIIHSEKMASLGQLTAGIAHEINNPISSITSYTEAIQLNLQDIDPLLKKIAKIGTSNANQEVREIQMLRDQIDLSFIQRETAQLLSGINNGTQRTAEIVRNLQFFSRSDHSAKEETDIHLVIDTTLEIMNGNIQQIARVEKHYQDVPMIWARPGQLNQVIFNILTNALDAIREKHPLQSPPPGLIVIRTQPQKDKVRISIEDNGPGISQLVGQKVFDPFFTTKPVGKGAGLGLSLSYGIIEQHEGRISWSGEEGKGATFIIELPLGSS